MHIKKVSNRTEYFNPLQLVWVVIKATWKLLLATQKFSADMIVIGKPHPMNSLAGIIGGFLKKRKVILDCDDYELVSNYYASSWQKNIIKFFENTTPKLVRRITTNTYFNRDRMISLGVPAEKIHYLPNGVDEDRFKNVNDEMIKEIKSRLGLTDKKIIAYIGSINLSNHPVDLLLKAFKSISEKIDDAILLIVGGGKDLNRLEELSDNLSITEKIIFTGRVSPESVANYYALADVTVDPVYDTEDAKGRCPLKMFESWLAGTAFITGDVGDRRLLAGIPPAALLVIPGEIDKLSEKINLVLTDKRLKHGLSELGKERGSEFIWGNIISQKKRLFDEID
jgi:glycosyltransferase involved in cell wall biosynthesis